MSKSFNSSHLNPVLDSIVLKKCLKFQQQSHTKRPFHTKSRSLHCISLYYFYLGMTFLPYIYNLHLKTHCIPRISHNHFLLKQTFTWCYQLILRGWTDNLSFSIHVVDICGLINADLFFFLNEKRTKKLNTGYILPASTRDWRVVFQYFLWLRFYSAEWFHKHKH